MASPLPAGYVREVLHFDHPVSRAFADLVVPAVNSGLATALAEGGADIGGLTMVVRDHYVYTAWPPRPAADATPPMRDLTDLVEEWRDVVVPRVAAIHGEVRDLAHPSRGAARSAGDLGRLPGLLTEAFTHHYRVQHTLGLVARLMDAFLREMGGAPAADAGRRALSAHVGAPAAVDAWIADLASHLRTIPEDPHAWVARLREDPGPGGAVFRRLWDAVRDRPAWLDVAAPTMGEDPTPLVRLLAASPEAPAPPPSPPAAVRDVVELALDARAAARTVNHHVTDLLVGATRVALLNAGQRLVASEALAAPTDAVHVPFADLRDALADGGSLCVTAARGRRAYESAWRATPPDVVGDVPADVLRDPHWTSLLGARPPAQGATLAGVAASPGRAAGPVRIVRRDADVAAFKGGEVLVVVNLHPSWTPLASKAAAVVADTGGLLCHAAVVARELRRPAVVGVGAATSRLRDGAWVEVDGEKGTVTEATAKKG